MKKKTYKRKRHSVLGVPVDSISKAELYKEIECFLAKGDLYFIVTANIENIYKAYRNPKLNEVFKKANVVTCDGMGVVLAGKLIGSHFQERITGVDLSEELFKVGEKKDFRFYFLGDLTEILEKAAKNIKKKYPKLQIVGYQSGGACSEEGIFEKDKKIIEEIKKTKPNFVIVGLGCPKQENWIQKHKNELGAVCMGVGGAFNFWADQEKRAPKFVQNLGFEWFFRLAQKPSRFKRVLVLPKFFYYIFKERVKGTRQNYENLR